MYDFNIKLSIYNIKKETCLVSVSTFYFLSYKIIFLTFFIHRFCSVFLSVFWIVIGLPFTHLVLSSSELSFFLVFIRNKEQHLLSFFLSFYGSLSLPAFSSIVYL